MRRGRCRRNAGSEAGGSVWGTSGHKDAESAGKDAAGGGQVADGVALDFKGHAGGAGEGEFVALEMEVARLMFEARGGDSPGEAEEGGPGDAFHEAEVELAVVEAGLGKYAEGTAVVAAVAEQDECGGVAGAASGDGDFGLGFAEGFDAGPEVGERAELFLEGPVDEFDGAGVEAGAGELDDGAALRAGGACEFNFGEVDGAFGVAVGDGPGAGKGEGDAEFAGDDIDGAEGKDAEAHAAQAFGMAEQAGDDFVDGAVTAGGDDGVEAFRQGFGGEALGGAGGVGGFEGAVGREAGELGAEVAGFVAAGGGIEDDAGGHG